jgi:hypothetical protein
MAAIMTWPELADEEYSTAFDRVYILDWSGNLHRLRTRPSILVGQLARLAAKDAQPSRGNRHVTAKHREKSLPLPVPTLELTDV